MIIHSIASAQPRVATLHLIVHELVVFLVVQLCAAKALGPRKSMIFGLIVQYRVALSDHNGHPIQTIN
jgi:hypothetical protein